MGGGSLLWLSTLSPSSVSGLQPLSSKLGSQGRLRAWLQPLTTCREAQQQPAVGGGTDVGVGDGESRERRSLRPRPPVRLRLLFNLLIAGSTTLFFLKVLIERRKRGGKKGFTSNSPCLPREIYGFLS